MNLIEQMYINMKRPSLGNIRIEGVSSALQGSRSMGESNAQNTIPRPNSEKEQADYPIKIRIKHDANNSQYHEK